MKTIFAALFLAAAVAAPFARAAPRGVEAGIYVLNLGKLDVASGAYTVDFYLSLKSADPIPDNSFEFLNGRAASVDKVDDKNGGREKFYRIFANLSTPIDLRKFPFDTQKMQIVIEDKTESAEKVVYRANPKESGMDAGIVFPGWNIAGWRVATAEHDYPVYGENTRNWCSTCTSAALPSTRS